MEFIEANPDKPWDWEYISSNPNITMKIIEANPDKPWNESGIFQNPNNKLEYKNEIKRIKRNKIIQSRLEKRIKNKCRYSKLLISKNKNKSN
jgi:hypothetical protein